MSDHIAEQSYSIPEFIKLIKRKEYKQYILSSTNAIWAQTLLLKIRLVFKSIFCRASPDTICLIGDAGSVCFTNVKTIIVSEYPNNTWDHIEIICVDKISDTKRKFVVLADK